MVSKEEIFRAGDIAISLNALDDHKKHGDMYPIPEGGCPIKVCHATRSITNPYEGLILVQVPLKSTKSMETK